MVTPMKSWSPACSSEAWIEPLGLMSSVVVEEVSSSMLSPPIGGVPCASLALPSGSLSALTQAGQPQRGPS